MTEASHGEIELLGARLGNYRVLSKLGEGGMGVVYVGHHETLGHPVVVKVLQPELSRNTEMVHRFFNEAQAATAIRNAGIVQVFDFGMTPDGRAYFVMELLDGENLAARLKQRRPSYVECCRLGRQIANVLQAAHARGITHRDLKPENLFLVPDVEVMGGERVKVLDFGIAKLTGDALTGVRTRTGLIMGTPHYMSPEQCRGAGAVDARSDIYSLGCILFEMACGRPPFVGDGAGEILGSHQFVEPPHPQSLAPDMHPGLAAVIANMLAKRPDARPQTMASVSQALDELLQLHGEPVRSPASLSVSGPITLPTPLAPMPSSAPTPLPAPMPSLTPMPLPASAPMSSATPSIAPASTTLGGAAGTANVRGQTRARRRPVVLGGLAFAGAVAAIWLATRNAGSPEPQGLDPVTSPLAADAGTPDAGQIVAIIATPPPPPDAAEIPAIGHDAAVATDSKSSEVEAACLRYRADQKWSLLGSCADRLRAANPALAKELASRAIVELKAAPRIDAFEVALQDQNLNVAKLQLDAISSTASSYGKLRQRYDVAEARAITDLVARLTNASSKDCKEYKQIVEREKLSKPPRVIAEATSRVQCTPAASACNADELAKEARAHYNANRLTSSLESFEAAYGCRPDPRRALSVFIVACEIPNLSKAKLFWKRMNAAMRQDSLGVDICVRNRITTRELNAP